MTNKTYKEQAEELKEKYNKINKSCKCKHCNYMRKLLLYKRNFLKQEIESKGCGKQLIEWSDETYTYCGKNFEDYYCPYCEQALKILNEVLK